MAQTFYPSLPGQMPRPAAASAHRGAGLARILPLVAVVYAFLLFPVETGIDVGGNFLPLYRIALIACLPFILLRYIRQPPRLGGPDVCMIVANLWVLVSFIVLYDTGTGLVRGIPIIIDIGVPYFLARTSISQPNDVRRFFMLLLPGIIAVAGMMAVESIGGRILVRPFFAGLFGNATAYDGGIAIGSLDFREHIRLGLLRAGATFSHPILAGAFLASTFPIWWMSRIRSWPLAAGLLASLACIFSVSSAAVLGLALGVGMIAIDHAKRYFPKIGWPLIVLLMLGAVLALELVSKNGAAVIIARNTLDPHTAFYRLLIWEYGSQSIAQHPWFGIGYAVYDRPAWMTSSVDAHFLNLGIRHGLIMPLMLLAAILSAMISLGMRSRQMFPADRDLAVGINIVLAMLVLVGFTVAYFGEAGIWFSMLIGIAGSLSFSNLRNDRHAPV